VGATTYRLDNNAQLLVADHELAAAFPLNCLRTTNMLEQLNRELKRRTRVATLFPNEDSLLRSFYKKLHPCLAPSSRILRQTESRLAPQRLQLRHRKASI
jgi:transposase-like protein